MENLHTFEKKPDQKCGANGCQDIATRYFLMGVTMGMKKELVRENPGVLGRCQKHGVFYARFYEELTDDNIIVYKVLL